MTAWLVDTLVYTGLLIVLVLALRGPVARTFGPQMAYALWALPLLRFIMPPIVLPSSLAPVPAAPVAEWTTTAVVSVDVVPSPEALPLELPPAEAFAPPPEAVMTGSGTPLFDTALLFDAVFALWLAGAVAFLAWRTWTYLKMREELLAGSRPVGEAGKVRLVETPAVGSPVAFGVADKVIALPMEFMAWEDRRARDLAIEHELAHHRGGDLLANILAQPVLALHWFNPLAWIGWSAMRRDQEAACDARVIACREPGERAHYGEVIASFAAGPRLALAAPMACPMAGRVLGEKSIIHRLRSLNMSEISPRRRLAGRALLAGAALALPLTASISYAEAQVAPSWPDTPDTPDAPDAPAAPDAPDAPDFMWMGDDGDVDVEVRHEDGKKIVTVTKRVHEDGAQGDGEKKIVRTVVIDPGQAHAPFPMHFQMKREGMNEEELEKFGEEWEKRAEEYAAQWEEWGEKFSEQWEKEWPKVAPQAPQAPMGFAVPMPQIDFNCDEDGNPVRVERPEGESPRVQHFVLCHKQAAGRDARRALERARASVEHDRGLSEETREEVLRSLDREIERLSKEVSAVLPAIRPLEAMPVSARVGAACESTGRTTRLRA